jgi:tetratricopeptide (TPR) repeat protein
MFPIFKDCSSVDQPVMFLASMGKASQPENWKKSWILEHPRFVIGIILIGCLCPFINKALHVDDPLFVWTAQWIQKHPMDFFGFKVNWWGTAVPMSVANCNPPLMSYFLAGAASFFGWSEIVLHLAGLVIAFMAALGIYALARQWCERPLLATVVAIFTPAFLVSSTTLMCDVFMLAFWIWTLVLWERGLASERSWRWFMVAGMLAGLGILAKYSAITLLPLLAALSILRTRKAGWWLLGLAVPILMLAGYELITARMYGYGLFSAGVHYAQSSRIGFAGGWKASGLVGLAYAGGSFLPLLFFAPLLWQRHVFWAGGVVLLGALLLTFHLCGDLGLWVTNSANDPLKQWPFQIQMALLIAGGLQLLLLAAVETWQRRDTVAITLALWAVGVFCFASVFNWVVNVRSFLPAVPAVAILLVRRLDKIRGNAAGRAVLWPLIPAAGITLSLAIADYQLANSTRTAVKQIAEEYKSGDHQVWFEEHWGFQYYMEKSGCQPIDIERSLLQPGDIVVIPELGFSSPLPLGSVGWVKRFQYTPVSWMHLMGGTDGGAAGFYNAVWGPAPFAIGKIPQQDYYVVKVFSFVQFISQPTDWRKALPGQAPDGHYSTRVTANKTNELIYPLSQEATREFQIASQLKNDGNIEVAIRHYRESLELDPDNPMALNDLAWILAAGKPELRNGTEAVQLATKAVEMTEYRMPVFIATLAVAYGEAGEFAKAREMAKIAGNLAFVTGQKEVALKCAKLLSIYTSDKTNATRAP